MSKGTRPRYLYHPREVAICGYSNSGKTTLICKLLARMEEQWQVAYVKHDAHRFEMDRPGKDTWNAWQSGAHSILIEDPQHGAWQQKGDLSLFQKRALVVDHDFALVEGHKKSALPKICILDESGKILEDLMNGDISQVMAFVGTHDERPMGLPHELPYIQRDNLEAVQEIIEDYLEQTSKSKLSALILTGGRSQRMGSDKALLKYEGKEQGLRTYEMLKPHFDDVYLSSRSQQWQGSSLEELPQINDSFPSSGPMTGILSAMTQKPGRSWFVIACDLPLVNAEAISKLLRERNPYRLATYVESSSDGLPEPLFAIYESRIYGRLLEAYSQGLHCPRKVLLHSSCLAISASDTVDLKNINYRNEYLELQQGGPRHVGI